MVAERNTRKLLDWWSTACCNVTARALATYRPSNQRRGRAILGSAGGTASASGSRRAPSGIDRASRASAGRRRSCAPRSEEHTSELQSQSNLVCRLLLEKKKKT